MFVSRKRGLVAAFSALVTSILAQDHSSEKSDAQITGLNHPIVCTRPFPLTHTHTPLRQIRPPNAHRIPMHP